jgi:benzylsuccinate CoA-transferase BbsF subunit
MATKRALEGLKVVDFGSMGVSPVCCKHLADYGATVVYIESHNSPDITRFTSPYYRHHLNGSMFYGNYNTSKLSVTISLTKPTGAEIAWRLVRWADVMSCGRPEERMAKWGFDYESVRRVKPEIIYYHTTNVGTFGPDSALFGHGGLSTALMGIQHLTGWPDRGPSNPPGVIGDTHNYLMGPIAILAALEYRDRTGKGQLIDLSQIETYLWSESPWILDYTVNGRIATRSGNRYPLFASNAPYGAFPCKQRDGKDRWVAICVTCDEEWQAFCKVIGQPQWTTEAKFATALARKQNEDALEQLVSEWSKYQSAEEVEAMMQAAGVPASAAESNKDLMEDPHLAERNYFRLLKHRELGPVPYSGPVFRLSKTPDNQSAAPCMGEHNEYVFKELLGMSEEEVNQALVEGGITTEYDLPQMGKQG